MKGTIKSKAEIERLFQSGRRSSSSCMLVLALKAYKGRDGRCAFIAGKKIGTAPERNRCKRVLREAARHCGSPWKEFNVAFIARRDVMFEKSDIVIDQMQRNLKKLGIKNNE